jgi:hypothetical protein
MPGTYDESITIPTGIAVRGHNLQSCVISQPGVTASTTVVTMGVNSRLEDMTVNVSSSSAVDITCVQFPDGTSKTAKLRTVVVNATNTSTGATGTCCGVKCTDSTTNNVVTSFNAIQRMTINATTSGVTGASAYGLLNSSNAYFSVRDTTLFATGTGGAQCIGVLASGAIGYTSIKTSTCAGSIYDIDRTGGTGCVLLLNATDLQNASSNGNGFSVNTEQANISFGLIDTKNPSSGKYVNTTYYLIPGTLNANDSYLPSANFPQYFGQPVIIFGASASSSKALTGDQQVVFNLISTTGVTSTTFATATLNASNQKVIINNFSRTIGENDYFSITATFSGTPQIGSDAIFNCTISIY